MALAREVFQCLGAVVVCGMSLVLLCALGQVCEQQTCLVYIPKVWGDFNVSLPQSVLFG